MKFKKFVPTKTGKKLVANAIANRNDILFKRLAFGSGIWNDSDLENAITLKDERQSSLIDTLDIIDETTIRCVASISNKDLESEYDITEIGLFVEIDEKEILYSICCSDEKVTMFTQAEAGFYQIKIGCLQKISSTSESKIYVSNESFISKEMFIKWVEETEDNLNKTLDLQNEHLESMESLLENTPYTTVESEGEFELPVHTINDSEISAYSTWSSEKIIETLSGYKKNSEAVVYGDVVSTGGSSTIITLDFPDGFNVENCYIKSFMWESSNTRRIASFGGDYDDSVAGFTQTGPYLAVSGVRSGHTLRAIFILDKFPGGITIPEL